MPLCGSIEQTPALDTSAATTPDSPAHDALNPVNSPQLLAQKLESVVRSVGLEVVQNPEHRHRFEITRGVEYARQSLRPHGFGMDWLIPHRAAGGAGAEELLGFVRALDEDVDFVAGVVKIEAGAGGGGEAEFLVQRHGAMMPRADGHAFLIEKGRQVMRMNVAEA